MIPKLFIIDIMILENIKHATAASHQHLESSPLLSPLTADTITQEHYLKVLRAFYGFFQPLEENINKITGFKQYLPDFESRRKVRSMLKDMEHINDTYHVSDIELCKNLPEVTNPEQAFGAMYVLEGSTLGGRFIAKNLKKHLNLDEEHGACFFSGYGSDTGKRWKTFQLALQTFSENFNNDQIIIQAANDTFEKLERWVNKK